MDADGDSKFTPPYDQAIAAVKAWNDPEKDVLRVQALPPTLSALHVLAAAEARVPLARRLVLTSLRARDPSVRLAATRAAEILRDPELIDPLHSAHGDVGHDDYLRFLTLRAMGACGPETARAALTRLLESAGVSALKRHLREVEHLLPGVPLLEWNVLGTFPAPEWTAIRTPIGPETDSDLGKSYPVGEQGVARWRNARARSDGYLDLQLIYGTPEKPVENCIAFAECWLEANADMTAHLVCGGDDQFHLGLDQEVLLERKRPGNAGLLDHEIHLPLKKGRNRLLFKIRNGSEDFGIRARILSDGVSNLRVETPK